MEQEQLPMTSEQFYRNSRKISDINDKYNFLVVYIKDEVCLPFVISYKQMAQPENVGMDHKQVAYYMYLEQIKKISILSYEKFVNDTIIVTEQFTEPKSNVVILRDRREAEIMKWRITDTELELSAHGDVKAIAYDKYYHSLTNKDRTIESLTSTLLEGKSEGQYFWETIFSGCMTGLSSTAVSNDKAIEISKDTADKSLLVWEKRFNK